MVNNNKYIGEIILFGGKKCSVCETIKYKIENQIVDRFSLLKYTYIDTEENMKLAALENVFTIPVVIVKFEGKEFVRLVRNFSISELVEKIERPYRLIFDN